MSGALGLLSTAHEQNQLRSYIFIFRRAKVRKSSKLKVQNSKFFKKYAIDNGQQANGNGQLAIYLQTLKPFYLPILLLIKLSRYIDRPFFPDHGYFDLTGEGHFRLYFLSDLETQFITVSIRNFISFHDYP